MLLDAKDDIVSNSANGTTGATINPDTMIPELAPPLSNPSDWVVTAVGVWLPCGRTNFFDHEDDQPLLETNLLKSVRLKIPYDPDQGRGLQSSVVRRLCWVLRKDEANDPNEYSYVYFRIPLSRRTRPELDESDPDSVIFLCAPNDCGIWSHPCWDKSNFPYGIALIVSDEGLYAWVTVHSAAIDKKTVQDRLKEYVAETMLGGGFYSHQREKILEYRDSKLGVLNFFQLNLILEGLHNFMFDEHVYFYQGDNTAEESRIIAEDRYSLGQFARHITAVVSFDNATNDSKTRLCDNLGHLVSIHSQEGDAIKAIEAVVEDCLNEQTQRDLLRRFLRATAAESLQQLKWKLERCRRSLLQDMINVLHLQRDLEQVVSPDKHTSWFPPNANDVEQSHLPFNQAPMNQATEDQLRGYVMLVSAKLPLIRNIQRYAMQVLDAMVHRRRTRDFKRDLSVSSEELSEPKARELAIGEIQPYINSWSGLYDAIVDNVRGLENAVNQARSERLYEEEHRIRAEQEAVAEIERIRHYTGGSAGSEDGSTLSLSENVLALLSLIVTLMTAQNIIDGERISAELQALIGHPSLSIIAFAIVVAMFVAVVGILAYLFLFYPFVHGVFAVAKRAANFFWKMEKKYYYEFDVRCDKQIDEDEARHISCLDSECVEVTGETAGIVQRREGRGYRAEIENADEGEFRFHSLYNIYLPRRTVLRICGRDVVIPWRESWTRWPGIWRVFHTSGSFGLLTAIPF